MLPSERGDVFNHVGRRGDAFPVELGEGRFEIESIPVDDGIDQKVQAGRPIGGSVGISAIIPAKEI